MPQATIVRLGKGWVSVDLGNGRVINKRPQDLYMDAPGPRREADASEAASEVAEGSGAAAATTRPARPRRHSTTAEAQTPSSPSGSMHSSPRGKSSLRSRRRGSLSRPSTVFSWLDKEVILDDGRRGTVINSGHGFYTIDVSMCALAGRGVGVR